MDHYRPPPPTSVRCSCTCTGSQCCCRIPIVSASAAAVPASESSIPSSSSVTSPASASSASQARVAWAPVAPIGSATVSCCAPYFGIARTTSSSDATSSSSSSSVSASSSFRPATVPPSWQAHRDEVGSLLRDPAPIAAHSLSSSSATSASCSAPRDAWNASASAASAIPSSQGPLSSSASFSSSSSSAGPSVSAASLSPKGLESEQTGMIEEEYGPSRITERIEQRKKQKEEAARAKEETRKRFVLESKRMLSSASPQEDQKFLSFLEKMDRNHLERRKGMNLIRRKMENKRRSNMFKKLGHEPKRDTRYLPDSTLNFQFGKPAFHDFGSFNITSRSFDTDEAYLLSHSVMPEVRPNDPPNPQTYPHALARVTPCRKDLFPRTYRRYAAVGAKVGRTGKPLQYNCEPLCLGAIDMDTSASPQRRFPISVPQTIVSDCVA